MIVYSCIDYAGALRYLKPLLRGTIPVPPVVVFPRATHSVVKVRGRVRRPPMRAQPLSYAQARGRGEGGVVLLWL